MLRYLIHVIFTLAGLCSLGCDAGILSGAQAPYKVAGSDLALFRDSSGTLTVDEVDSAELAAQFEPLNGPIHLGYVEEVVWLRLRLQRQEDAPQTWFLEFSNLFVNDLRLYAPSASGFTVAQAGDQFAFAERVLQFRFPVFALPFPDVREQTFYLRLESDSSLAGQLLVWQPEAKWRNAQQELFYFGLALGMISMSFLVSTIHWLLRREWPLLHFALLTVTSFCMVASGLGLVAEFLTPTLPMVADLLVPWSLALNTVLVCLVFGNALHISADFPRISRFFKLACGLALAAPMTRWLNLYQVWGGPMLQLLSLGVMCCTGWVSWVRWRSNSRGAASFLAAHVILIASLLAVRIVLVGWLPADYINALVWIPGMLAFLFLVHAGIFVDSQAFKHERDAAFNEAQTAKGVLVLERTLRAEQAVFFSFVAHELRAPLSVILVGVKNLEKDLTGAHQKVQERTKRIKVNVERLGDLINRHLTLQRLDSGNFLPQFSMRDVRLIGEESLFRVRALFLDRVFALHCAEDLSALAYVDQDLLRMGLENLLINAAKFSPDSTAIALDVFADTALHVRVSDRGPGIPADQIGRLFSIFNRASHPTLMDGFGIGLAIVQRVARAHGGSVGYADRAGGGAVFTLTVPLLTAAPGGTA